MELEQTINALRAEIEDLKKEAAMLWHLVAESQNTVYLGAKQLRDERERRDGVVLAYRKPIK